MYDIVIRIKAILTLMCNKKYFKINAINKGLDVHQ
jgi:hypothetical protein